MFCSFINVVEHKCSLYKLWVWFWVLQCQVSLENLTVRSEDRKKTGELVMWGHKTFSSVLPSVKKMKKKPRNLPKNACRLIEKINTNFKLDIKKSSYVVSAADFIKFFQCLLIVLQALVYINMHLPSHLPDSVSDVSTSCSAFFSF